MIRRFLSVFFVFLTIFFAVSCESSCEEGCGESNEETPGITLRVIDNDCSMKTIGEHSLSNLGSITFTVTNSKGDLISQKSFKQADITKKMDISGIKDVDNATVTISGFGAEPNEVKWTGKITGVNFKSGKTTSINAILYPATINKMTGQEGSKKNDLAGTACLPDPLTIPRFGHTATLLQDGRILITGGFTSCSATKCMASKSVEIIDVESGQIETLADMNEERAMHEAILLSDGSVAIFGGVRIMEIGSFSVAGETYPTLPYNFSIQAISVEKYMPSYPKLNMRNNNIGTVVENTTADMGLSFTTMPFFPYQTYYVQSVKETEDKTVSTVYLVGGMDKNLTPTSKVYSFSIVDIKGTAPSLTPIKELAPVDKDTILSPAAGISAGTLFSTGGRALAPASVASFYTETGSTAWEGTGPNLFYTKSLVVDDNLYTFGGLENTGDTALASNKKAHRWNIAQKTVTASDKSITAWGSAVFLSDIIYDTKNSIFIVVGGAGGGPSDKTNLNTGSNIYQVIKKDTFSIAGEPLTYPMKFQRILPRGTIDQDKNKVFITGGISELGNNGITIGAIEINILQ